MTSVGRVCASVSAAGGRAFQSICVVARAVEMSSHVPCRQTLGGAVGQHPGLEADVLHVSL